MCDEANGDVVGQGFNLPVKYRRLWRLVFHSKSKPRWTGRLKTYPTALQKGRAMNEASGTTTSGRFSSLLIAVGSFWRGLPFFLAARPKTPLRVLCLMSFDTLHRLRASQRIPVQRLSTLAALLDFGASANAAFDGKKFCSREFHTTRQLLEEAGFGSIAEEYWRRIQELERQRPNPGGNRLQFQRVRAYREEVVRLSLGVLTQTVFGLKCLDDAIRALNAEDDLTLVFAIVMQCQIIDDVVDYSKDAAAGLPSFLTAAESLPQSFELTCRAARSYAENQSVSQSGHLLPWRLALFIVSAIAKLVMTLGRWRQQIPFVEPQPEQAFGP